MKTEFKIGDIVSIDERLYRSRSPRDKTLASTHGVVTGFGRDPDIIRVRRSNRKESSGFHRSFLTLKEAAP